jgi:hypothetical protein
MARCDARGVRFVSRMSTSAQRPNNVGEHLSDGSIDGDGGGIRRTVGSGV